jgi:hypothetical protein
LETSAFLNTNVTKAFDLVMEELYELYKNSKLDESEISIHDQVEINLNNIQNLQESTSKPVKKKCC